MKKITNHNNPTDKPKVALALASGGARGMTQIGAIEELERRGYEISAIAGSSIGSVVGGLYAAGELDKYRDWIVNLQRYDIMRLMDVSLSSQGLVKGERVFNTMRTFINDRKIEDLKIPFVAVAVDLLNYEEVLFTEGSMFKAMRASVSIPTMFKPLRYKNSYLVDGGLLNPLPVDRVQRTPGDILVAIDINANIPPTIKEAEPKESGANEFRISLPTERFEKQYHKQLNKLKGKWNEMFPDHSVLPTKKVKQPEIGFFELMTRSIGVMQDYISVTKLEQSPPDVMMEISRFECSVFDFHRSEELIELGRQKMAEALDAYEQQNAASQIA